MINDILQHLIGLEEEYHDLYNTCRILSEKAENRYIRMKANGHECKEDMLDVAVTVRHQMNEAFRCRQAP
jgi:hypothetical protein